MVHPAVRMLRPSDQTLEHLYKSGEVVPAGSYERLDDGRIVRLDRGGVLPHPEDYPRYYMRVSCVNRDARKLGAQ